MKVLFKGKYLNVIEENGWEYVERHRSPGAVIIVGMTPENKVVLVEQYRIPMGKTTIEFPAGLVSDHPELDGENFADAARREFLEETGYEAEDWEQVAHGPTTPGLSNEVITIFLAKGLKKVGKGGGVGAEKIIVHEVPLGEVHQWLGNREREGIWIDQKVYAGLYFISR